MQRYKVNKINQINKTNYFDRSKKEREVPVVNNSPYGDGELLKAVNQRTAQVRRKRRSRDYFSNLFKTFKLRIRTTKQSEEHRRGGHLRYPPACP